MTFLDCLLTVFIVTGGLLVVSWLLILISNVMERVQELRLTTTGSHTCAQNAITKWIKEEKAMMKRLQCGKKPID